MKSRPVLITFSVLAGAQVLTAGTLLAEVIGEQLAGLLVLIVAAVQAGMSFYVSNQVVTKRRARQMVANRNEQGVVGDNNLLLILLVVLVVVVILAIVGVV